MLKHRLLMSALLIPATIGLFVWDHHLGPHAPALFVLVMLLAARCVWELVILARKRRPSTESCPVLARIVDDDPGGMVSCLALAIRLAAMD